MIILTFFWEVYVPMYAENIHFDIYVVVFKMSNHI